MRITVDSTTDTESLVGGTFTDQQNDTFTITTANQAPELTAVAYAARSDPSDPDDRFNGGTVMGFLPYGSVLAVH